MRYSGRHRASVLASAPHLTNSTVWLGDSDPEDRGGEGREGGVAARLGLILDIPGDGSDLWVDVLQQSGVAHGVFEESLGDGGEGVDGDKAVGAGGTPGHAVL
jgi:hypothetical protein